MEFAGPFTFKDAQSKTNAQVALGLGSLAYISSVSWSVISGTPTTLSGYGITDNVTTQGNSFNGVSQLVKTDSGGNLPVISGANVTGLNANNLATGTVSTSRLPNTIPYVGQTNTFTATQSFAAVIATQYSSTGFSVDTGGNVTATSLTGNGAGITSIAGSHIQSATVPLAALNTTGTPSSSTVLFGDAVWRTAGAGTVTGVSSGNLSPLFTTGVATSTTTPAISYTASTAAGGTALMGPAGSGPGAYSFRAILLSDLPNLNPYSAITNNTSSAAPGASNQTLVLGSPGFTPSAGTASIQQTGSINNYFQAAFQNTSAGTAASTDFIATNDAGNDSNFYVDLGINSSGFSGSGPFSVANGSYLYSNNSSLAIGTNNSSALNLATNSTTIMSISGGGTISVPAFSSIGLVKNDASGNLSSSPISGYIQSGLGTILAINTGASNSLDYIPTASGATPLNSAYMFVISGNANLWYLRSGTDANSGTTQRPVDYNASTNAVVWQRII